MKRLLKKYCKRFYYLVLFPDERYDWSYDCESADSICYAICRDNLTNIMTLYKNGKIENVIVEQQKD